MITCDTCFNSLSWATDLNLLRVEMSMQLVRRPQVRGVCLAYSCKYSLYTVSSIHYFLHLPLFTSDGAHPAWHSGGKSSIATSVVDRETGRIVGDDFWVRHSGNRGMEPSLVSTLAHKIKKFTKRTGNITRFLGSWRQHSELVTFWDARRAKPRSTMTRRFREGQPHNAC